MSDPYGARVADAIMVVRNDAPAMLAASGHPNAADVLAQIRVLLGAAQLYLDHRFNAAEEVGDE